MESNTIVSINDYAIYCARSYNPGNYAAGEFKGYEFEDMNDLKIIDEKTISFTHGGKHHVKVASDHLGSQPFITLMEDYNRQHEIAARRPSPQYSGVGVYERPLCPGLN